MSPALKPGTALMSPPVVDLGGSAMGESAKFMESHRWGGQLLDLQDHRGDFNGLLVKSEHTFGGDMSTVVASSGMVRPAAPSMNTSIDIDIQEFLTDECSINSSFSDKCAKDDHDVSFLSNNVLPAKRALMARDCFKWDTKNEASDARDRASPSPADDDATFEQELLLDLANVEPGAWEVPLSPLNDEEDVMPWLDLCF